ncbi:hypothetical protein BGW36DRAFT_300319 [Talaromyces proteolyticus]|uniref:ER-bound oxygenase mpaB/mpaB'/Rubber oxygenase catalytic domain-containing protein n=1 Tax=Talaromyces proteolyticus TaxID=1131652 RepID=A0AAD4PXP7_9EURO|nr:uncharacterized protein BGW36DRAFT_300319 [Talaromyces proteolyticus]KAH8693549.1 hypothetical protein BGW36DRAFT_300319 [Talaromyces proteolyticus]
MKSDKKSEIGYKQQKWSYRFIWTDKHLGPDVLKPLRHDYDELGALTVERLLTIKDQEGEKGDLYKILEKHHSEDAVLTKFWNQVHHVPKWVDWEQIARGQQVFYRYALANIIGFALQGFICENSASTGVVEVLVRTGGFSTRVLLGRLLETFQWLLEVTRSQEEVKPGGRGFKSTVRVRLLHSSVRRRILHLAIRRPEYYDVAEFGVPANTMDSIHSITTFSLNPMFLQLPQMGITPRPQEIEDYLALFRYLAHIVGTPTEYFSTVEEAKALMESCYLHELNMTETSKTVAYNFVRVVESLPPPLVTSRGFIEAGSRWLNGHELCDELGLGRPGFLSYVAFAGLCVLVNSLAWTQRLIPAFDKFMIEFLRSKLYWAVVENEGGLNGGTNFEMKYKPRLNSITGREEATTFKSGHLIIESFFLLCTIMTMVIIMVLGYAVWDLMRKEFKVI